MATAAKYANHRHYLREGWAREPKASFRRLAELLVTEPVAEFHRLLDVGCATGELVGYLKSQFPAARFTGVDLFPELVDAAAEQLPDETFRQGSVLDLSAEFDGAFDVVTAMGCMSIFDENDLERFWDNLLRVVRPGGRVVVLAPLNEFGCDVVVRHRKRIEGGPVGAWESGWNTYSFDTITELLARRGKTCTFERFAPELELARRADPVRTWTLHTAEGRHFTNGLKLIVDHYFISVTA
jgi:SAM-dependent methyltransferase